MCVHTIFYYVKLVGKLLLGNVQFWVKIFYFCPTPRSHTRNLNLKDEESNGFNLHEFDYWGSE